MRLTNIFSCKVTSAHLMDLSSLYPSDNRISPILAQQAYCSTNIENFRNCRFCCHTCDDSIVYACFKEVKLEKTRGLVSRVSFNKRKLGASSVPSWTQRPV